MIREPDKVTTEAVEVPIGPEFDLHTFSHAERILAALSYLEAAAEKGYKEVVIIQGKGTGEQRKQLRQRLQSHPLVEYYEDAPEFRGGKGATLVRLKKKQAF